MSVQEMAWLSDAMSGETGLSGINADVCLRQGLDGTAVISITQDGFIHFGLTYSQAADFVRRATRYVHVWCCYCVRVVLRSRLRVMSLLLAIVAFASCLRDEVCAITRTRAWLTSLENMGV